MLHRLLLAVVIAAGPLAAQPLQPPPAPAGAPERPKLARGDDPNDWRSYFLAGHRLVDHDPKKARAAFWWASRYAPSSADALHGQWVALWLGDPRLLRNRMTDQRYALRGTKAEQYDSVLVEALSLDPFVGRQLVRLLWSVVPGAWQNDDATQGFLAYAEGRHEEATRLFASALRGRTVDREQALYYRALAFHGAERYDSAAAELSRLAAHVRRETDTTRVRPLYESAAIYDFGVGKAYIRARMLDSARAALMRALGEEITLYAAHSALAEVALLQGRKDEAVEERRLALELRPASGALTSDYGTTLLQVGRFAEAEVQLRRAIELEPFYAGTYYNLAFCLEQLGRPTEAVAMYRQFLAIAPKLLATQIADAQQKVGGS